MAQLPYVTEGRVRTPDELPLVHILVEEAPSVLNPARMKFGSVFRDISRQGRKFGIGLGVVSQQVSEIDAGVLTQLNTQLTMALGNADERREAVRAASSDIAGFAQELQVLDRGQLLLSSSLRDIALPVQVPNYDDLEVQVAGEKRGLAFEALTALLLERATGFQLQKDIRWNHAPLGLSIVPDFTVGKEPDAPDALVLVSFPASYLNSNFKFWLTRRAMGGKSSRAVPPGGRLYSVR